MIKNKKLIAIRLMINTEKIVCLSALLRFVMKSDHKSLNTPKNWSQKTPNGLLNTLNLVLKKAVEYAFLEWVRTVPSLLDGPRIPVNFVPSVRNQPIERSLRRCGFINDDEGLGLWVDGSYPINGSNIVKILSSMDWTPVFGSLGAQPLERHELTKMFEY